MEFLLAKKYNYSIVSCSIYCLVYVHQEKVENLSLPEIAQEFIWDSQYEKKRKITLANLSKN